MRNFKIVPRPGKGSVQDPAAIPGGQVVSDSTDPERAAHLISVVPGGVHLTPLHPVYADNMKQADRVAMLTAPGPNSSRVRRAGR